MKLPKAAVEACDERADMYVLCGIGNEVVKAERLRTLWLARERSPFHMNVDCYIDTLATTFTLPAKRSTHSSCSNGPKSQM